MDLHPGDVILIEVQFHQTHGAKVRPALVVLDSGDEDFVAAQSLETKRLRVNGVLITFPSPSPNAGQPLGGLCHSGGLKHKISNKTLAGGHLSVVYGKNGFRRSLIRSVSNYKKVVVVIHELDSAG